MSVAELGHVGAEAIFGSFGVRANADRGGGGGFGHIMVPSRARISLLCVL